MFIHWTLLQVAGFWNGLCGEVDKSKPPVGTIALQYLWKQDPHVHGWVVDLLFDQHLLWNRWWARRYHGGMVSPGSTRSMLLTPISCINQDPVGASRCETGLDNSPLYDGASFVPAADTLDVTDVGMTSLVAADASTLANLSVAIGRHQYTAELNARAAILTAALNSQMWDPSSDFYMNRKWHPQPGWAPKVAAPTNFYPMLVSAPTDAQVITMVNRWLTNSSEFGVSLTAGDTTTAATDQIATVADVASNTGRSSVFSRSGSSAVSYGMPSVSRSSPAFKDNSYWRGRAWGPMNWLVYLGLRNYDHLPQVRAAMGALAAQSEAGDSSLRGLLVTVWFTRHCVVYWSLRGSLELQSLHTLVYS
jgi:hypothetical protein